MSIILGIDPGSRVTGYGVVRSTQGVYQYIASGCIRTEDADFIPRLAIIYAGVQNILATFSPNEVAVEQVFVKKNVVSALKLGQARGAALAACGVKNLVVSEYLPTQVKKALVGAGRADKEQIQHMVKAILKLSETPPQDAADALAVALCHAQMSRFAQRLQKGIAQ